MYLIVQITTVGISSYSTDVEEGALLAAASPMPFISPAHHAGPHMQSKTHASSSAAPAALHTTHPHLPGPTASVPLQPLHVQPHAGSLYNIGLPDRPSLAGHTSHAQHSELNSAPIVAAAAGPSQAGTHARLHPSAVAASYSTGVASAASPACDRTLTALAQPIQPGGFQPMYQQPLQSFTALQAKPSFAASIAVNPAVLPLLQQPALQGTGGPTVPTNSAPSQPHQLPQAMSSLTDSQVKPQLSAPAMLPLPGAGAASSFRSNPSAETSPAAIAGLKFDLLRHEAGSESSQALSSLQAALIAEEGAFTGPQQASNTSSPVLHATAAEKPALYPLSVQDADVQDVQVADRVESSTSTATGQQNSLSFKHAPGKVYPAIPEALIASSSSSFQPQRAAAVQQSSLPLQQAAGSRYPAMPETSGASSSSRQPRSLMQTVSANMYPVGITPEASAESLLGELSSTA